MGRKRKNARSRPKGRKIYYNKYITKHTICKGKNADGAEFDSTGFDSTEFDSTEFDSTECEAGNIKCYQSYPTQYEIWFAQLGYHRGSSVQGGCRPVLIISNNMANRYSAAVTVIPLTSKIKSLHLPTHVIINTSDCTPFKCEYLYKSVLLAEQVVTIDKSQLKDPLCRLDNERKIEAVKAALDVQLGIRAETNQDNITGKNNIAVQNTTNTFSEIRGDYHGS